MKRKTVSGYWSTAALQHFALSLPVVLLIAFGVAIQSEYTQLQASVLAWGHLQSPPDPDPRAQQITALVTALNEERAVTDALKKAVVSKNLELQQQQGQLAQVCITTIEKANAGKQVNPATFAISDKPKPAEKTTDAPKKDGGT